MKKWLGKIVIMTLRNAELLQFSKSVEDNADAWVEPCSPHSGGSDDLVTAVRHRVSNNIFNFTERSERAN